MFKYSFYLSREAIAFLCYGDMSSSPLYDHFWNNRWCIELHCSHVVIQMFREYFFSVMFEAIARTTYFKHLYMRGLELDDCKAWKETLRNGKTTVKWFFSSLFLAWHDAARCAESNCVLQLKNLSSIWQEFEKISKFRFCRKSCFQRNVF